MTTGKKLPNILTESESFNVQYPAFDKFAEDQLDSFWRWNEIKVEKDKNDLLTKLTESELHGLSTTLKLFTKYEVKVGKNYWAHKIMATFPNHEIQRMAAAFCHTEYNSHVKFYNELNVVLGLNTEEFYESWMSDPVLVDRISFMESAIRSDNLLLSIAAFALVEGAVLYSNFAFIKHFQANGKNLLKNLMSGIDQSVIDENIHHEAGCGLFKQLAHEMELSLDEYDFLYTEIEKLAFAIYDHEAKICDELFSKGPIEGITAKQLKEFVKSRINMCLSNLGVKKMFEVTYNPISDWFYGSIGGLKSGDFFQIVNREYQRSWSASKFMW